MSSDMSTEKVETSPAPSIPPSQLEAGEHPLKKEEHDPNIIDFDGPNDPDNALNWPAKKKIVTTMMYSFCTMGSTWASTSYNSGLVQVMVHFDVSQEVALLGMSLFLFGNAFGPLLWAPISEVYGRKPSILIPIFGVMVFSFATATSKDIQTLLITRFFAGVFGGAPLSNVGGVLADIWAPEQRGVALLSWGLSVIIGPLIAPIVGGALVIAEPTVGWRWTEYVTGIILAVVLSISIFTIQESFAPVILARKANRIRHETKNWAIRSKSQEEETSFKEMGRKYGIVPFEMLVDPIAFVVNLYAAFVYAIIYLAVPAFPYEFIRIRGWNSIVGAVPYTAIIIGVFGASCVIVWGALFYKKRFEASGGKIVPENRLPPMMIGSIFFAGGLFIMAWTADVDIHWIGFCIGSGCLGLGFFTIFQSSLGYIVDTYLFQSASAIAANMFMRSMLAGAFPLFANALFTNLGIDWGLSLLGFLGTAMIPIPFVFWVFGRRIRAKGKHSKKTFIP